MSTKIYFLPTYIISLLSKDLWRSNLSSWWVKVRRHHQHSHIGLLSRFQVSCDKLETFYFWFLEAFGYPNWQSGGLWWTADHMITRGHKKKPKKFISSHTKLDKIGAYDKKSKSTNSSFFSITSSEKVTWLMKNVIFRLPWGLMSVISTRWWLIRRCY